ncbi:bifunctional folylpolyglutamate synthase/dihydrofolate synthase [Phreatobacter cathodiphilus]|uniref:Dihydrofolate synthase/folylpolyglutamate synthase n=1 Tax=Phreatobacter cathodiphilus TaxID=1868589 RepID=A0A2S0N7S5_9HYPH|nr:folylpolyglutamate synthase/dihydrofolate synthase family protein [Phreatobacter cathodiphilus]AVO44220.1 bifunctional folylpolyglutamate synthase/dihydrofolate synthase [Phreatobacter cathodiphilus]
MTVAVPIATILDRLAKLHPKLIDLSLDRMTGALERLGNPHLALPPVIHVAGTNGKGSTSAFARAFLEASGRTVHVYTSPHLVTFNERYRLGAAGGGRLVDDATLADVLLEVERVNEGQAITQFEITTIAGLMLFARHPADAVILEVGMGGRFDATNVVPRPAVSVITPVSMDHADFLGDTVAKIAGEKAGILKRGRPVVVARQTPEAMAVIETAAETTRSRLFVSGLDWFARSENGRFVFQDDDGLIDAPPPRLAGAHQFENAGTALMAVKTAGFSMTTAAVERGLQTVAWPGRLQRLTGKTLEALPTGAEVWLDGGHNPGGGEVLAKAVTTMQARQSKPLVMIAGMISTKDPRGFLDHFRALAPRVLAVPFGYPAALSAPALAEAARAAGLDATACDSLEAALAAVKSEPGRLPPRVLITGSLYLAGEVLAKDGWEPS